MDFTVNIDAAKLDRALSLIPKASARKAYMRALRAGAAVVRDSARNNIKQVSSPFTGILSRKGSVTVYNYKKRKGLYRVGVQIKRGLLNQKKIVKNSKTGQSGPVRVATYAAVLEYGKDGQAPRSWIRKAAREGQTSSYFAIVKEMDKGITEAVRDATR